MSSETEIFKKAIEKDQRLNRPEKNPYWYKSGIIYELHVRSFQDGNGDGTGDFRGLTSRLDYLRDLGITALWLLPFYPSPLKDDGYDIANYYDVHPMYGTLADFKAFLREAHRRNLRVITELVLNHTSDQHPWFQRARRSPAGSKFRDYYVWNDTADKYRDARIIFKDTEFSNWSWDPVAKAFYWHRFFFHQPDLNFESPLVQEETMKVLDFWFDLGVDGVRLDAVPYLYEREGTSCENLPETHEFLKKIRRHVDEKYGDRMLLAEANQWPEDAVAYFGGGKGDECHMAFHFPLMPRLFMSLRMEDRVPIVDIMQQTPPIPETAQWALFLRNHDELTLEMVTDEERDYMYRMYADLDQARLNLGIRRRLAPLVGNDRRRIELLTALLFSLPGTPVIYYGDEIGMGDNIFLGDRNGVRTPMQWSADKNAGFSRANPQSLFLPINLDPENHYEAVNVETQERNNHSLLWWTRRLIALYKRQAAFGAGTLEFLHPENRKIFACLRRYENETILVVANLSRFVQPVELDLTPFLGLVPFELFGRAEFPTITDRPYFLTLGPHAFYWFSLEPKKTTGTEPTASSTGPSRPTLNVIEDWLEILDTPHHFQLERALQQWLPSRGWFSGQKQTIKNIRVEVMTHLPVGTTKVVFTSVQVEYVQTDPDRYALPLAGATGEAAEIILRDFMPWVIARLNFGQSSQTGVLYHAVVSRDFCRTLLEMISAQQNVEGESGQFETLHTPEFEKILAESAGALEPSLPKNDQDHHSSIVFGEKLFLKLFLRMDSGINPDLEILRFLTAQNFPYTPPLAGAIEYREDKNGRDTVAVLSAFVPKAKDAWEYTLDALGKFFDRVQTLPEQQRQPQMPGAKLAQLAAAELPEPAKNLIDTYLESARLLGQRTAALHLALAADTENKNFAPEPFTPHAQRGLFQSLRNLTRQNFQLLNRQLKNLPPEILPRAQAVLALEPEILKKFKQIYERRIDAARIRLHGDYHLSQVLYTGKDFFIVDFKGEPAISISERRLKRCALQDVASMVRSFHYATYTALLKQIERGTMPHGQIDPMVLWARFWTRWVSAVFYKAYLQAAKGAAFLPATEADLQTMTEIFLLRKAIFELGYELNHRPDWAKIPLQGILELIDEQKSYE
jgi:maltose alpha-D-glucosyltransferase/alpha-amylase